MASANRREFGGRLREVRADRSLSMKQLAGRVGVSLTVLGRYERGRVAPGMEVLVALGEALDVSIDYLATGVGPRRRTPSSPRADAIERIIEAINLLPRSLREALSSIFLEEGESAGEVVPNGSLPGGSR